MAEKKVETTGLLGWIDACFPASELWKAHLSEHYTPKNFNFRYFFGSLALLVLAIQITTGTFLVMSYKPGGILNAADIPVAYVSVEFIMREVSWGWLVCYMHSTGASAFLIIVCLYMSCGMLYGSYRKPRELVWILGCLIFLCLMAEVFMGYLLPWDQMSYWGAQVIVNLFSAIPLIGPDLSLWIRGDYVVSDATLNRFFSFRAIAVPLALLGLMVARIIAFHEVGSNNPDGVEIKAKKDERGIPLDGIPFHLYYSVHDIVGVAVFLFIFGTVMFFAPETGGYFLETNNFISADSLRTPLHIVPVWYFTPFYSVLRATTLDLLPWLWGFIAIMPGLLFMCSRSMKVKGVAVAVAVILVLGFVFIGARSWGVVAMGGSVAIFLFLPWLGQSSVKSIRYRPGFHKTLLILFAIASAALGYLGIQPLNPVGSITSQIGTALYFVFFLAVPIWSQIGTFKPVPECVTFMSH